MRMKRLLISGLIAAGAMGASSATWAQLGINLQLNVPTIQVAPPPPQAEFVPAPRPGFVWSRGYWSWQGGQHVWVPGHWIEEHPGQHWIPEHWAQRGPNYVFVPGHWVTVQPNVIVAIAPPPQVQEQVPPAPPGYVWAYGYWYWNGSEMEWAGGHWEVAQPGAHFVNSHWDPTPDGRFKFVKGYWAPN